MQEKVKKGAKHVVSPKELHDALKQGEKLVKNRVTSPDEGEERHKPSQPDADSDRESQQGKLPSIADEKAMNAAKEVEELQKKQELEKAAVKTEEFVRSLQKTQDERGKEKESPEHQHEKEEQVLRETKKHEEKLAKEVADKKETPVLHGSATCESMEKERLMNLKPDATPSKDKGAEKGLGI